MGITQSKNRQKEKKKATPEINRITLTFALLEFQKEKRQHYIQKMQIHILFKYRHDVLQDRLKKNKSQQI